MTDDVRQLLGGYATGTLTEAERALLFEAALEDQRLFEALADEQVLRDLLQDSSARGELLRATGEPRFSVRSSFLEWLQKPVAKALLATGMILLVAIGITTIRESRNQPILQEAKIKPAEAQPEMVSPSQPVRHPEAPPPVQPKPAAKAERRASTGKTNDFPPPIEPQSETTPASPVLPASQPATQMTEALKRTAIEERVRPGR